MPPVFVLVFLGCSQVIYASPSKYLLDSSDEIPNAYGRSVEYTYVYDSSKDAHPVAKVKYGKFIRNQFTTISLNSNAQRNDDATSFVERSFTGNMTLQENLRSYNHTMY
ncbi:hypothetical protein RB195_013687 [Necator americanus]|uniref:Vitellogenin domain-containing protein n=1 Tax=Necator americanus TaxID=51031 RepID=A0ABR1DWS7_NECAM